MKIRKALRHQKSGKGTAKRQGSGRVGAPRQSKESKREKSEGLLLSRGGVSPYMDVTLSLKHFKIQT